MSSDRSIFPAGTTVHLHWDPVARNWVDSYGRHWEQTSFERGTGNMKMMPLSIGIRSRKFLPNRSQYSQNGAQ